MIGSGGITGAGLPPKPVATCAGVPNAGAVLIVLPPNGVPPKAGAGVPKLGV